MPGTARRGRRSAAVKKKDTENETLETAETGTEKAETVGTPVITEAENQGETTSETGDNLTQDDGKQTEADKLAASGEKEEETGHDGEEVEEMTVELQVTDQTYTGKETQGVQEEALEVLIEEVPEPNVKSTEAVVPDNTSPSDEKDASAKKADEVKPPDAREDDSNVTMVKTEESGKKNDAKADIAEVEVNPDTEPMTGSSAETSKLEQTHTTLKAEPVTPVKGDQTQSDLTQSSPDQSPVTTDTGMSHHDSSQRLKFPASLAKLRNLTVNIGPIRQIDLKSEKLHEILTLSDNFEIKFELRDKKDAHGRFLQEKLGFVRLPFEITTPTFLIRVAHRLGSLHIDGRDMSVKFPEAFNKALDECKAYMEDIRKLRAEKFEMKKRQISVKNVPANVSEDTIRSLFPEAQKITLNYEELPDGGSKVGSVLLDFDTEEACIQCLDMNKDVFIEDCQLKIFRLYSDRRSKTFKPLLYQRGRGTGRGRMMTPRGGFQAAKIRKRVLGFGNVTRGKGIAGNITRGSLSRKPLGSQIRKPAIPSLGSTPSVNSKSPIVGGSPRGPMIQGRGQRRQSSSGIRPGSYQSVRHEGQFKDFTSPNREFGRGRRGSRPYRGRGSKGYQQRSEERSPSLREELHRQSPNRSKRSQPRSGGSYRSEQRYSPSSSRGEDPMAMMEYLKSTIARMEEKMSARDYDDRGYDRREEQPRTSGYGGRARGNSSRGRGRGRGDQSRKRPSDTRDYGQDAKRPYMGEQSRRDSRSDYYEPQQNLNTGGRNSVGRAAGDLMSDYRHDRDLSSHGSNYGGGHVDSFRSGGTDTYGGSHGGTTRSGGGGNYGGGHGGTVRSGGTSNYGGGRGDSPRSGGSYGGQAYRSSGYEDGGGRHRRDSYGGRSENFSSDYGGGQFGIRGRGGGGRGKQRGRGYNKGSRGQLW